MQQTVVNSRARTISSAGLNKDVADLEIDKIVLRQNYRSRMKDEEIAGLMGTIKDVGLLEPVLVTPTNNKGIYELISGYRRLAAVKKLGHATILARVLPNEFETDAEKDFVNIIENLQRENPTIESFGKAYSDLVAAGYSKEEIAKRIGKSKDHVDRSLRAYGNVPKEFQRKVVATAQTRPGTVSLATAEIIERFRRTYKLTAAQVSEMYSYAIKGNKNKARLKAYAEALASGSDKQKAVAEGRKYATVTVSFFITQEEKEKLLKKYPQYSTMAALFRAKLLGEVDFKFTIY